MTRKLIQPRDHDHRMAMIAGLVGEWCNKYHQKISENREDAFRSLLHCANRVESRKLNCGHPEAIVAMTITAFLSCLRHEESKEAIHLFGAFYCYWNKWAEKPIFVVIRNGIPQTMMGDQETTGSEGNEKTSLAEALIEKNPWPKIKGYQRWRERYEGTKELSNRHLRDSDSDDNGD